MNPWRVSPHDLGVEGEWGMRVDVLKLPHMFCLLSNRHFHYTCPRKIRVRVIWSVKPSELERGAAPFIKPHMSCSTHVEWYMTKYALSSRDYKNAIATSTYAAAPPGAEVPPP